MPALPIQLIKYKEPDCAVVSSITFNAARTETGLSLHYQVQGNIAQIKRPEAPGGSRLDALWRTTCFELFLRAGDAPSYFELNFAPNGDWAAYRFDRYRENMQSADVSPPTIATRLEKDRLTVEVELSPPFLGTPASELVLGPAVIIETLDSVRSYWALHHPVDRPDFHRAQNFQTHLD